MNESQSSPEAKDAQVDQKAVAPAPRQKKTGRSFLTILVLLLTGVTAVAAYLREGEFFQNLLARDEWVSRLIGNLHPIFMLFPLGILLAVLVTEIMGWLSFGKWKPVTIFALFLALFTAILAALSGVVLMQLEGNSGPGWTGYLWFGIGGLTALAMAFLCKIWGKNGNGRGFLYALFLFGAVGLLGYGGASYGQKVHRYTVVPAAENPSTPFVAITERENLTAQVTALQSTTSELSSELTEKAKKVDELTSNQQRTAEALKAEQRKRVAADQQVAESQKKATMVQQQLTQAQGQSANLTKQVKDLQQSKIQLQATHQKQLEQAQQKAAQQLKKMQSDLQALQKTVATKEQTFQKEIKKLQAQLEAKKEPEQKDVEQKEEEAAE